MKRATAAGQSASSASATADPVSSLVAPHEVAQLLGGLALDRTELDQLGVDPALVEVEHEGVAAGHAGREVAAGRAEHHRAAAGHVLAAVVAHALDDRGGAGVAHAEPLPHAARG